MIIEVECESITEKMQELYEDHDFGTWDTSEDLSQNDTPQQKIEVVRQSTTEVNLGRGHGSGAAGGMESSTAVTQQTTYSGPGTSIKDATGMASALENSA